MNYVGLRRIGVLIVLATLDTLMIANYYRTHQSLPFTLSSYLTEEIHRVLPQVPVRTPPPTPNENYIEFSEGQWIGSIVYGKLRNYASIPLANPELRFALSRSQDERDQFRTYTATLAATLQPDETLYFSQRFPDVPVEAFWWTATIQSVDTTPSTRTIKLLPGSKISAQPIMIPAATRAPSTSKEPWGVAKQIDDVTWTIKVGQDERMATPQETLVALNTYRTRHGSGPLSWDENLARLAQSRATYLNTLQSTDAHKGFKEYIASEEHVRELGFWSLGENSGYGNQLLGVHLIEWIYAADEAHNKNQLDTRWSHVGIGIEGLGTAFIFGGDKI